MDVEHTVQFILEQHARAAGQIAAIAERQVKAEAAGAEWRAKTETVIAAIAERQLKTENVIAAIAERQLAAESHMAAIRQAHDGLLVVQREQGRVLMRLETNIDRLEATQLVTEQKLQGLIDALNRGANGHQ